MNKITTEKERELVKECQELEERRQGWKFWKKQ